MKKHVLNVVFCLLMFTLAGCGSDNAPEPTTVPVETSPQVTQAPAVNVEDERNLRMNVEVDHAAHADFPPEELGGNADGVLGYVRVTNVSIEVDGNTYHLEDAVRDGIISIEEIEAYARMDARMGYCKEEWRTYHSLTHFIYRYPEFDLRLTHDIYKTPDGQEHLINEFYVCENADHFATRYSEIDQEDWGLTFEDVGSTSTSLTVDCTQSGGQQIGQLRANHYWIDGVDENGNCVELEHSEKIHEVEQWPSKPRIARNTTTRLTIDWTEFFGELPQGSYVMGLSVLDEYDPAEIHPLMEDFQANLLYHIEFTIS